MKLFKVNPKPPRESYSNFPNTAPTLAGYLAYMIVIHRHPVTIEQEVEIIDGACIFTREARDEAISRLRSGEMQPEVDRIIKRIQSNMAPVVTPMIVPTKECGDAMEQFRKGEPVDIEAEIQSTSDPEVGLPVEARPRHLYSGSLFGDCIDLALDKGLTLDEIFDALNQVNRRKE